jgi:hypothetical protein
MAMVFANDGLRTLAHTKRTLETRHLFSDPVLGRFIGLMVLSVSWMLPSLVTTGNGPIRPVSLAALSGLGGYFSEDARVWLENAFPKISKDRRSQQ